MGQGDYRLQEFVLGFAPGYPFRVGDVNGDGLAEYVAVAHGGQYMLVLGSDGRELWDANLANTDKHTTTALEIADVDGDGEAEVVVGEEPEGENNVLVLDWQGQVEHRVRLPLGQKDYDGNAIDSFGVADVDGDGRKELIVAVNGGSVYALDHHLKTLWARTGLNPSFEHFVHSGDLDGDGRDEVAVSGALSIEDTEHNTFYLLDHDGKVRWTRALAEIGPDKHVDYAIIAAIEGERNRRNTMITATGGCLFDAEGNLLWTVRDEMNHGQWVDVGDVRKDLPGQEILLSELWGFRQLMLLVSSTGEVLWRFQEIHPYGHPTHAYFIDWKGDGQELCIIGEQPGDVAPEVRTYRITLVDPFGEVLLRIPFQDTSVPGWFYNFENSPAVCDVDGDGRQEFVFPTRDGRLLIVGEG